MFEPRLINARVNQRPRTTHTPEAASTCGTGGRGLRSVPAPHSARGSAGTAAALLRPSCSRPRRRPPGVPTCPDEARTVLPSTLTADNGMFLMGADIPNSMEHTAFNGSISLSGDDEATLSNYFEQLSAGGEIGEPLTKAPWGDTFGMCKDKFGVHWIVNIAGAPA